MNKPFVFNAFTCSLSGVNLVEASAGTGKTYNIQTLVGRAVLEGWELKSILVVTFTNAATVELKNRIRSILNCCKLLLNHRGSAADKEREQCEKLLGTVCEKGIPVELLEQRIDHALRDFDHASIFTIHGFCSRILEDYAFESGGLFRFSMQKQVKSVILPLSDNYYRAVFYDKRSGELQKLLRKEFKITRDSLYSILKDAVMETSARIRFTGELPDGCPDPVQSTLTDWDEVWLQQKKLCKQMLDGIRQFYEKKYFIGDLQKYLTQYYSELDSGKDTPSEFRKLYNLLIRFDKSYSAKQKQMWTDEDDFPEYWVALMDALTAALQIQDGIYFNFVYHGIRQVRQQLEEEKKRENFLTFDDLLTRLLQALQSENADDLIQRIRQQYRMVLIDEFQDTDHVQYRIFERLFIGGPVPGQNEEDWITRSCCPVFFIGDPKQAIYSFRGADVFAYAGVAGRLPGKFSLPCNYRSSRKMIQAVNQIFDPQTHWLPFLQQDIRYQQIGDSGRRGIIRKDQNCEETMPLKIYSRENAEEKEVFHCCIEQICQLLDPEKSPYQIEEKNGMRELEPGDIAVLVRSKKSGSRIREMLADVRIPAVFVQGKNIYKTDDALELFWVLKAIEKHNSRNLVFNALATPICGKNCKEIYQIQADRKRIENEMIQFEKLKSEWKKSFWDMFQLLLEIFEVRIRYLGGPDGERKLTNLLFLRDLLYQVSLEKGGDPGSVLDYLESRISQNNDKPENDYSDGNKIKQDDPEEEEEPLDTDRNAVRIMTVHASKGLEFPVVLLPDLFADKAYSQNECKEYHQQRQVSLPGR